MQKFGGFPIYLPKTLLKLYKCHATPPPGIGCGAGDVLSGASAAQGRRDGRESIRTPAEFCSASGNAYPVTDPEPAMAVAALSSDFPEQTPLEQRRSGGSDSSRSGAGNSGRVRSSRVGFRIGPLGLTYTHRRLDLDSEELERFARAFERQAATGAARTASFLTPDDLDHLSGSLDQDRTAGFTGSGNPALRRGAEAYAAMASGRNEGAPRALLSVV